MSTNTSVPQRVEGLGPVVDIQAGFYHVCARRENGEVLCWGANDHGQLGDGTREGRNTPALVRW